MALFGMHRARFRTAFKAAVTVMALVAAACGKDSTVAPVNPQLPSSPVIPPQYRGAAFIADISSLKKSDVMRLKERIQARILEARRGAAEPVEALEAE